MSAVAPVTALVAVLASIHLLRLDDVALFAGEPSVALGVELPGSLGLTVFPAALAGLSLALWGAHPRPVSVTLRVVCVALAAFYWAKSLLLHAPLASAVPAASLLLTLATVVMPRRPARPRAVVVAGLIAVLLASLLAALSYGAIRGETRCADPTPIGCLPATGLPVQVPRLLHALGVELFLEAPGADLRGADLAGRDLRYVRMPGADLRGVDLSGSHLRRADLREADLRGAALRKTWAQGADLRGARLGSADMSGIRAYRIDLRGADLTGVTGVGASLSHAALAGVRLSGADLRGAYLRFTTGLTQAALDTACTDAETRLPPGMRHGGCKGPRASAPAGQQHRGSDARSAPRAAPAARDVGSAAAPASIRIPPGR